MNQDRRTFIKTTGLAALGSMAIHPSFSIVNKLPSLNPLFVGTPVLPEYLFEKGIANTLDQMKELAGIETVMVFTHDHVFRQYQPGFQPKKDANGDYLTNVWVRTHPEYYANSALQGRNDELKFGGRDVLDELWEEAAPRKMRVYGRILEPYVITGAIPGFEEFAEIDANGQKGRNVCYNHPEYMAYWESVVNDLVHSHPYLHGFKYGQERGGPIFSSMGKTNPGTCFCEHCVKLAKERNINIEKARAGLIAVQQYGLQIKAGDQPVDGNFVTFLRILMEYPEVLAWEKFWMDSREEQRKRMFSQIKSINPAIEVGWHIDHGMTWDLITRASWDYATMGPYSDWLSVALYFDSMGRRSFGHYKNNYQTALFGDASEETSWNMYLSMLGYDPKKEPGPDQHRTGDTAFTPDYVYRECQRVVKAVNGSARVDARIGFDMPGYDCNVQPAEVYEAVQLALKTGVNGLWCGREWDELTPPNIEAFGNSLRDYLRNNR